MELQAALLAAAGDRVQQVAVAVAVRYGPPLPALLDAGLISVGPAGWELGGGARAEIAWNHVGAALDTGRLQTNLFQAAALRAAAQAAAGAAPPATAAAAPGIGDRNTGRGELSR